MSDYYTRDGSSLRNARKKKRRRQMLIRRIAVGAFIVLLAALIVLLVIYLFKGKGDSGQTSAPQDVQTTDAQSDPAGTGEGTEEPSSQETPSSLDADQIAKAKVLAAQYDYDGAIALLQSLPGFENDAAAKALVDEFTAASAACVQVDMTQVPHVFFHTLIVDFERCFASYHNKSLMNGYNAWMVTIEEFEKCIQQLYDNNYVIINISDIYQKDSNGNYAPNTSVKLPAGKKAVVFSYDDTAYYCQYMDWGMADRMVFDENGDIKCEYTDKNGNTTTGNYDHVPILIDFCREHPDFAWHGHKGTLALTGYNGVFGYRTEYRMFDNATSDEKAWLDANPWCQRSKLDDYIAEAKVMAQALKDNGFEFASHTWGHRHCDQKSLDWLKTDTSWWLERVGSIVGPTDIFVFPHGSDIGGGEDYTSANEKYAYLKSQGFGVFCGVDGVSYYWNQFRSDYVRQSRIDIDGYLMWRQLDGNNTALSKLGLDVNAIFDRRRPTPVTTS